jgi:DNA-binding response OmpR family regulator
MNSKSDECEPSKPVMAHRAMRNPGILIADDMGLILALLRLELEPRGFNVWLAMDGESAINLYRLHRQEIDLVLLDVLMPGLNGPDTLAVLQRLNPKILACFMSRKSSTYPENDLLDCGAAWVFTKPLHLGEVADFLQLLVNAPNAEISFDPTTFVCDRHAPKEKESTTGAYLRQFTLLRSWRS